MSVIFCRSVDVHYDARLQKYFSFLLGEYNVVFWNREFCESNLKGQEKENVFMLPGGYGRGWLGAFSKVKWNIFLFRYLCKKRRDYTVVHACDIDAVFPALLIKALFNKVVVYDIYDFHSNFLDQKNRFAYKVVRFLEKCAIYFSDKIILPDMNRMEQVGSVISKQNFLEVPNIPLRLPSKEPKINLLNKIYFIGTLGKDRLLLEVIEMIGKKFPNLELYIGGFGELKESVSSKILMFENTFWLGSVSAKDVMRIQEDADLIFAIYDTRIKNNIYASPNKLFEAMSLGIPIIVSSNTLAEKYVLRYQCGEAVDYGNVEQLEKAINSFSIEKEIWNKYGANGLKVYKREYDINSLAKKYCRFIYDE